ncbi:unnamed protein product (macronuclear) [Paramecium tetraurelia]|uniref:FHA domain-containing protein n=1 Tax=Paramecium tetraurelia TaxID=5888 RepID=A0BS85_PARTE|nr:uncharacterized protein GSPATT00031633001 [Paramecium tetraurelia]CAK61402.1 unnamed protein product [Paramecium tetraurelia]|eukprot:XP_001428800.1 hypothetical protein (macronuclear) [Paramecium tetraurelia strain d4-2]
MGNCQNCLQQEQEQVEIQINNHTEEEVQAPCEQPPLLNLDVKTWQKDSYSLYDYENNTFIHSQQIPINGTSYLTCQANKVLYNEGSYSKNNDNSDEILLLPLEYDNESFQLVNLRYSKRLQTQELAEDYQKEEGDKLLSENQTIHADFQLSFNIQKLRTNTNRPSPKGSKIWLVTRSIQTNSLNEGLVLKIGDVIKLGRVKLTIKEIQLHHETNQDLLNEESICSIEDKNEFTKQCRICLSTGESTLNPLIDPCKCIGSTKYVHINCLLKWIQQSSHFNSNAYCTRFIWKSLECEICKSVYPPVFERNGKQFDLIELSKPKDKPFIIMEFQKKRQNESPQSTDSNGLYIVNFGSKKELKIGRNHEVEISIADISVSREHAHIKLVDNKIILSDKRSKFGTLVLLQKNITLAPQLSGLELQIKRTLIKLNNNLISQTSQKQRDFELYLGRNE